MLVVTKNASIQQINFCQKMSENASSADKTIPSFPDNSIQKTMTPIKLDFRGPTDEVQNLTIENDIRYLRIVFLMY